MGKLSDTLTGWRTTTVRVRLTGTQSVYWASK
jgi:hypothetical protein